MIKKSRGGGNNTANKILKKYIRRKNMKTGFFLVPTTFTGKILLPLDYRVEQRAIDRRTRFFKFHKKYLISSELAKSTAEKYGMRIFEIDGEMTRVLAPNGLTAYKFYAELQRCGFGKTSEDDYFNNL